jgi:hypothetical protein
MTKIGYMTDFAKGIYMYFYMLFNTSALNRTGPAAGFVLKK